jgi:hypothetical protein
LAPCVQTQRHSHPQTAPPPPPRASNEDYNQVVAYSDAVRCENAVLVYPMLLEHPFDEKVDLSRLLKLFSGVNTSPDSCQPYDRLLATSPLPLTAFARFCGATRQFLAHEQQRVQAEIEVNSVGIVVAVPN